MRAGPPSMQAAAAAAGPLDILQDPFALRLRVFTWLPCGSGGVGTLRKRYDD